MSDRDSDRPAFARSEISSSTGSLKGRGTGLNPRWWEDPWWEAPEYRADIGVSLTEMQALFGALRQLFDEDWMRCALAHPPNRIIPVLCGARGLWPFRDLVWLGRIALALVKLPTVHRPVKDLIGEKADSTLFEMEVASWFATANWEIEFIKRQPHPTPDLGATKADVECHIECKRMGQEAWERWVEALQLRVGSLVAREIAETPFEILFEPRLSELRFDEEPLQEGILEELALTLLASLKTAISHSPPANTNIPGIGELRMRPDWPKGQISIGGISVSPQGQLRRMVTHGVLKAASQLKERQIGAVVLRADFTPSTQMANMMLLGINRGDPTRLRSVAIVVFTARVAGRPVIWVNPARAREPGVEMLRGELEKMLWTQADL